MLSHLMLSGWVCHMYNLSLVYWFVLVQVNVILHQLAKENLKMLVENDELEELVRDCLKNDQSTRLFATLKKYLSVNRGRHFLTTH